MGACLPLRRELQYHTPGMVGLIQEKLKSGENEASDPAGSRSTRDSLSAMSRRRAGARLKQTS